MFTNTQAVKALVMRASQDDLVWRNDFDMALAQELNELRNPALSHEMRIAYSAKIAYDALSVISGGGDKYTSLGASAAPIRLLVEKLIAHDEIPDNIRRKRMGDLFHAVSECIPKFSRGKFDVDYDPEVELDYRDWEYPTQDESLYSRSLECLTLSLGILSLYMSEKDSLRILDLYQAVSDKNNFQQFASSTVFDVTVKEILASQDVFF